jgi:hypothetical protein
LHRWREVSAITLINSVKSASSAITMGSRTSGGREPSICAALVTLFPPTQIG